MRLTAALAVGQTIGAAVLLGFVELLVRRPIQLLWAPMFALAMCGPFLALAVWWARLVRRRPRQFATRLSIAMFVYLEAIVLAFVFGEIWLGMATKREAIRSDLPLLANVVAVISLALFWTFRRMLVGSNAEDTNA